MQGTHNEVPTSARPNFVTDLVWFALASVTAGLTTAITAGAVVMLLV